MSEHNRATDPAAVALVRDCFTNADRAGLANAIVSIAQTRGPQARAVRRAGSYAVMTGSAHPDWSPQQMRTAAALLPHGSARVLDGPAYLVPLEAPGEFGRCVQEFWAARHPPWHPANRQDTDAPVAVLSSREHPLLPVSASSLLGSRSHLG